MNQRQAGAWYLGWLAVRPTGVAKGVVLERTIKGSSKSGNWGHKGVKGRRGGSAPGAGHGAIGITPAMSQEEIQTAVDAQRARTAAKKKPATAKAARRAIIKQDDALRAKEQALRQAQEEYIKELTAFREEYTSPLIKQKLELYEKGYRPGDPEMEGVEAELSRYRGKLDDMWAEHARQSTEIKAIMDQRKEAALQALELPKDQQAEVELDFGNLRKGKTEAQAGVDAFNRLVSNRLEMDNEVEVTRTQDSRAFYTPFGYSINPGTIGLATTSGRTSMLHELGHWLEDRDRSVHTKALNFLNRRTAGESAIKMRDARPGMGYDDYEITKVDQFSRPYMGKVYQSKSRGHYATEIVSMGLEELYKDAASFARKDPDYFDFMYSLLRGQ